MGNSPLFYKNIIVIDRSHLDRLSRCVEGIFRPTNLIEFREQFYRILNQEESANKIVTYLQKKIITDKQTRSQSKLWLGDQLAKGSYGTIHVTDGSCVAKKTIMDPDFEIEQIQQEFIEEHLTSIILWCLHDKLQTYIKKPFQQPFVSINALYQTNDGELISVMEKLDMDGWKFFRISDEKEQLSVLSELCHLLSCLQQSCGFTHGDLHLGNIMFSMFSNTYRPYIIDLGMACADLSLCCNANPLYVTNSNYPNHEHCGNKSHDLRRLLFCIFQNTEQLRLSNKLSEYVIELFSPSGFRPNGLFSPTDPYGKLFDNKVPHQNIFYQSVSDIDDSRFYPENVLSDLTRLMS